MLVASAVVGMPDATVALEGVSAFAAGGDVDTVEDGGFGMTVVSSGVVGCCVSSGGRRIREINGADAAPTGPRRFLPSVAVFSGGMSVKTMLYPLVSMS